MKVGMISLMGGQTQRLSSHNAGWTFTLREILKSKGYSQVDFLKQTDIIEDYDAICINNGVNFKAGAWNFIGGPPATLVSLLLQLQKYEGRLFSFNEEVNLNDLVQARKELVMLKNDEFPQVELCKTTQNGPKLIIGDSHTVSIYRPGWAISRNDGATLYGALKNDGQRIKTIIEGGSYSSLHLYFGNIDARFHLGKFDNHLGATHDLFYKYVRFAGELVKQGYDVTLQGLIPIEDESRKIPGTGLYKGVPFNGSMEKRQDLVDWFNFRLEAEASRFGYTANLWNFEYPLDFKFMEATRSVHIRPEHYYYDEFRQTYMDVPLF